MNEAEASFMNVENAFHSYLKGKKKQRQSNLDEQILSWFEKLKYLQVRSQLDLALSLTPSPLRLE